MSRLPIPVTAIVPAADSPAANPLDTLQQRIAAQRSLLAAWNEAREAARVRHARDIDPLHDTYCSLLAQQVQQLDVASAIPGLSKVDRAHLREVVAEWAGLLASASRTQAQRAQMQDIQRRHEQATEPPKQPPIDDLEALDALDEAPSLSPTGDDSEEENTSATDSTGNLESDWESDWEQSRAMAEKRRAAHHASRRKKQAAQQSAVAPPSLREVYRRVASAAHPDREPDPALRAHKTNLMQAANRAHAAQDLLGLLELLQQLGDTRVSLAPYQALLQQQLSALEREVRLAAQHFCDEFGVPFKPSLTPDKAAAPLRASAQRLRHAIAWQRAALRDLPTDAPSLRRWLREEMAIRRQQPD